MVNPLATIFSHLLSRDPYLLSVGLKSLAVGTTVTGCPRHSSGVQFYRLRFLGYTRFCARHKKYALIAIPHGQVQDSIRVGGYPFSSSRGKCCGFAESRHGAHIEACHYSAVLSRKNQGCPSTRWTLLINPDLPLFFLLSLFRHDLYIEETPHSCRGKPLLDGNLSREETGKWPNEGYHEHSRVNIG